jgi:23S rRNA pseudouridine1911/1915/1917 synthase
MKIQVTLETLKQEEARRIDVLLAEVCSESRSYIQSQIALGAVSLNSKPVRKAGQAVRLGDTIEAEWKQAVEPEGAPAPVKGDLSILFEDDFLLALNKPQGLVVHPAASYSGTTVVHHLLHHFGERADFEDTDRPGIVHRLDKGTSGVLIIAKNRKSAELLSQQFKDRSVKKLYEALTWGKMEQGGRFQTKMGRDKVNRLKHSSRTNKPREAITDWKCLATYKHFSHVLLAPLTGRTHQLRVHLSESHHPIVGDNTYGSGLTENRKTDLHPSILEVLLEVSATFLHAKEISFQHPFTKAQLHFMAERPALFTKLLQLLDGFDR